MDLIQPEVNKRHAAGALLADWPLIFLGTAHAHTCKLSYPEPLPGPADIYLPTLHPLPSYPKPPISPVDTLCLTLDLPLPN
jgi:hypothetical protein